MVIGNNYKRKLVRIRNATSLRGIVLVEKARISEQYFQSVQKFVVFELGMTLLLVASQTEASWLLIQLPAALAMVQQIPGVGKVKALALLQQFPSIHQLSNATTEELEVVVGRTIAQQIRLNQPARII
ncbi:UNVERIFIED_CONTAM: hypothetical protein FKN15_059801 [Acipenser sinensis]